LIDWLIIYFYFFFRQRILGFDDFRVENYIPALHVKHKDDFSKFIIDETTSTFFTCLHGIRTRDCADCFNEYKEGIISIYYLLFIFIISIVSEFFVYV